MAKLIKTAAEYRTALEEVEVLVEGDPQPGSAEADRLDVLALLIAKYEEDKYPLDLPDPIEAIKFRMEQQGLKNKNLIPYIGSQSRVSEVLNRKRPLTLKMMRALNKHLGIPAEVLLQEPQGQLLPEIEGIQWERFPINAMYKKGWFKHQGFTGTLYDAKERSEELIRGFFASIDPYGNMILDPQQLRLRQKTRLGSQMDAYALCIWQVKVIQQAQQQAPSPSYSPGIIDLNFLQQLVGLSYMEDGPKLAQEFLLKSGIQLIIVPHLPKTHLDGAAMHLPEIGPIVALTLRYDRLDNFWFCLCHELTHIAKHLNVDQSDIFVDDFEVDDHDADEQEADDIANDALLPPEIWDDSLVHKPTKEGVLSFAHSHRIHPAIVAGRIRNDSRNYRILARMIGQNQVRKHFPQVEF